MSRTTSQRKSFFVRTASVVFAVAALSVLLSSCGQSERGVKGSGAKAAAGKQSRAVGTRAASGQGVQAAGSSTITGTVEYLEGNVAVNGVATEIGAQVKNADTITTGNDGLVDITFLKRNIIQIQPNSVAVLNFGEIGRGVQLESGALAAVLKNLTQTKSGNRFQVDTPTMVAGVRGTTFYLKVLNISSTYFCLCNGEVYLQDNAGDHKMTLEAAHHTAVEYMREGGVISVAKKPMLYHTDAEMQALASKIGYTINWKKPDLAN